jgi:hypothetical protein
MFYIFKKIKNSILKYRNNYLINKKFILHNKKYFNKKHNKINGSVLVEFNSFTSNHVILSNIANVYSKKFNFEIVSFFNYALTSSPAFFNLKRNLKWYLGAFFSLGFFKIYKSFNVKKFIKPYKTELLIDETSKIYNKIINKLKSNDDVLNIDIKNIHVGDLIQDGYIYYKRVPKVNLNSQDFKKYLYEFISIFLFWENYFNNNNVKAVIGVHAVYAYGIIFRIAISKNIDSILNIGGKVHRLSESNKYQNSEFKFYKETFQNFSESDKSKALKVSEYFLSKRFSGKTSAEINEYRITTSPFSIPFDKKISVLKKSDKLKVIIFPHELNDCSNSQGLNFFPDYVSWLETLVEISKNTNYDWYAKNHPQFKGKFEKYQPYSHKLADNIFSKNSNIKILPSNTSHHQIIGEGIDFGLTVNGDVSYEYAYFGIPILTATNNCNTSRYDFNIHSKNREDYINKIINLENLKTKSIDKNFVLECYFMMDIYFGELSLLENYFDYLKKNKSNLFYDTYFSNKIYSELLENWSDVKQENLETTLKEFITSKDYILSCKHSKKSITDLINTYQKK